MQRVMRGSRRLATALLNSRVICGLALCALMWMLSGSVMALVHTTPLVDSNAYVQAESTVNVVVSSTGCSPSNSTQTAGQITLHVTNQTGAELAVQLYGSHGELIREVNMAQGTAEWSETFNLAAGTYTLIAGHKTEWVCHITVQ